MTNKLIPAEQAQKITNRTINRTDKEVDNALEAISIRIKRAAANGNDSIKYELHNPNLTHPILQALQKANYKAAPITQHKPFGHVLSIFITWNN